MPRRFSDEEIDMCLEKAARAELENRISHRLYGRVSTRPVP
jgi:hypothetical protein